MRSISLVLTTRKGGELGRLLLPSAYIVQAEKYGPKGWRAISQSIDALYACIDQELHKEGLESTLDPLSLRLTVSRSLLGAAEYEPVLIPVPIRLINATGGDSDGFLLPEADDDADLFKPYE